jgi:hypothetical protein
MDHVVAISVTHEENLFELTPLWANGDLILTVSVCAASESAWQITPTISVQCCASMSLIVC